MKPQIILDNNGIATGVYITIEDWIDLKEKFPEIEKSIYDIPNWQRNILDKRLADINSDEKFLSIEKLFEILDSEI